jgi:hypothetical protein
MSIILENQLPSDQRFAKKNNVEYNLFSTEVEDAAAIENWIGIDWPQKVLLDKETYARLRNKRIEWHFDDKNSLESVEVKESGEVKGE